MADACFKTINLGTERHFDGAFPLALAPVDSRLNHAGFIAQLADDKHALLALLDTTVPFCCADFPVTSDLEFDAVVQAMVLDGFTYAESLSNAVRHNRTERVFTANEAPPQVEIFLHHEMAQTPIFPSRLFFYCEQAAESGGATPLCRSDVLLNKLDAELPEFTARCRELGARYTNVMPAAADAARPGAKLAGHARGQRQGCGRKATRRSAISGNGRPRPACGQLRRHCRLSATAVTAAKCF